MAESHDMPAYLPEDCRVAYAAGMAAITDWAKGRDHDPPLVELLSARQGSELELSFCDWGFICYRHHRIEIRDEYRDGVVWDWRYGLNGWEYRSLEEVFDEIDRLLGTPEDLVDRLDEAWGDWRESL